MSNEYWISPHGTLVAADEDTPFDEAYGWVRATQADIEGYRKNPQLFHRLARIKPGVDMRTEFEGPTLGVRFGRVRRDTLEDSDLKRAKIGAAYAQCTVQGIQDFDVQMVIKKYISNLEEMQKRGAGLVLSGQPGVGKSGAAYVVAMEAMRWAYSAYVCSHEELQELRFDNKQDIGDGQLVVERVRSVDLLVLDNFNADFMADKVFGPTRLEKLIRLRNAAQKSTILTTQLTGKDFKSIPEMWSLYGVMQETMVTMTLEGKDLRQNKNAELLSLLGLEK